MFAPVPSANQRRINAPFATSISRYGLTANAAQIQRIKDRAMLIVVANFPTNCSYAGFAKFTMLVITIAAPIRIIIVVCMFWCFCYIKLIVLYSQFSKNNEKGHLLVSLYEVLPRGFYFLFPPPIFPFPLLFHPQAIIMLGY